MDVIILTLDAVMAVVNLLRLNFFCVYGGHFSIYFFFYQLRRQGRTFTEVFYVRHFKSTAAVISRLDQRLTAGYLIACVA